MTIKVLDLQSLVTTIALAGLLSSSSLILRSVNAAENCDTAAVQHCDDPASTQSDAVSANNAMPKLPPEAVATVNELDVKLRYFRAIGFLDKSDEQRRSIVAIYEQYKLPVPAQYQNK